MENPKSNRLNKIERRYKVPKSLIYIIPFVLAFSASIKKLNCQWFDTFMGVYWPFNYEQFPTDILPRDPFTLIDSQWAIASTWEHQGSIIPTDTMTFQTWGEDICPEIDSSEFCEE